MSERLTSSTEGPMLVAPVVKGSRLLCSSLVLSRACVLSDVEIHAVFLTW